MEKFFRIKLCDFFSICCDCKKKTQRRQNPRDHQSENATFPFVNFVDDLIAMGFFLLAIKVDADDGNDDGFRGAGRDRASAIDNDGTSHIAASIGASSSSTGRFFVLGFALRSSDFLSFCCCRRSLRCGRAIFALMDEVKTYQRQSNHIERSACEENQTLYSQFSLGLDVPAIIPNPRSYSTAICSYTSH